MVVTSALILRLAKMADKDVLQLFNDNPKANYAAMVKKCDELISEHEASKKYTIAERIDVIKFLASTYDLKQRKGAGAIEVL